MSFSTANTLTDALTLTAAPPPGDDGLSPDQRVGGYRLVRRLGRGGFGSVWEAERDGGRVALKVLVGARGLDEKERSRFQREARLAAALSHPHCVFVIGAEEHEGLPVIVLELAPRGTLQDRLAHGGPLPWAEAVEAVLDVAAGLEAALAHGFLHRDVKPSNCFVDDRGRVKVGDFGLSKPLGGDVQLTTTGAYLGTPAYSSPEQVRGQELDARSDQFALGSTLYALLTARLPFAAPTASAVLARIVSDDPDPFPPHLHVPIGLRRVVRRMLARDRGQRFASYADLRAALLPYSRRAVGPAMLAQRFGAALIDLGLIQLLTFPLHLAQGAIDWKHATGVATAAVAAAYFAAFETRVAASPGKRLLRLRVVAQDGSDAAARSVLLRSVLFVAALFLLPLAIPDAAISGLGSLVALVAAPAALFVSARTSNGWAGLHEIASGTRVVSVAPSAEPAEEPRPHAQMMPSGETFGELVATATLWQHRVEQLLVGHDPVLERAVWIHRRPAAQISAPATRPRRLRSGEGWDAYEHVTGFSLAERVAVHGPLAWKETAALLASLAERLREAPLTAPSSALHVWLEPGGRGLLLPFPATQPPPDANELLVPEGHLLLRQVALLALTGRVLGAAGIAAAAAPAVAEEANETIAELWRAQPDLEKVAEAARRPPAVDRQARAHALLLCAAGIVATMLMVLPFQILRLDFDVAVLNEARRELAGWRDGRLRGSDAAAVEDLLLYADAASERTLREPLSPAPRALAVRRLARALQNALTAPDRERLRALRDRRAPVSREAAQSALQVRFAPMPGLPQVALTSLMLALMLCSLPGLLFALLFGGGLSLMLSNIAVHRRGGEPAGWVRRLWRAAIVWSPGLVLYLPGPPAARLGAAVLLTALFLAGAALAARHPRRGLQDVLAGTVLVPG